MNLHKIVSIILLLLNLLPAQKVVLPEKIDDFSYNHSWWEYRTIGCAKKDPGALDNGKGYLFVRLRNPNNREMCDVGISDLQGIYKKQLPWLEAIIRVKVLNAMKPGSRGWGFWRMRAAGRPSSLAWFMEQMGALTRQGFTWSKAGVISSKGREEVSVPLPEGEWHLYRIVRDRASKTTAFYRDGKLLLKARVYPTEPLSFHCWIDNGIYHRKGVYFAQWQGESALVVDYVVIRSRRQPPRPIRNDGAIVYFQNLDEFYDSSLGSPWKTVSFQSHGKPVLISLTTRLEAQTSYTQADQLTLKIDGRDLNSMPAASIASPEQMVTLNQWVTLQRGRHTMEIAAQESPFLRNITILEPDSILYFNSQFQWRNNQVTIPFSLNTSMEVLFYITGNAFENTGWNLVYPATRDEASDGDVAFFLDGEALPEHICGNQVFGNGKVVVFKRVLGAGEHRLTIQRKGKAHIYSILIGLSS